MMSKTLNIGSNQNYIPKCNVYIPFREIDEKDSFWWGIITTYINYLENIFLFIIYLAVLNCTLR